MNKFVRYKNNSAPCAQLGGADTGVWQSSCSSIGCASGDCFDGITHYVGCPATNTAAPSSVPMTTSAMESKSFFDHC